MEQEEILQEPVYSQQVLEFLAVAHKYCQFMEQLYRQSAENISDFLVQILPLLYFRGSLLPVINQIEIEVVEKYVTEEEWQALFNDLRQKFLDNDEYWFVENDNPHNDLIRGSLSDNLADIYQDLKDFVILYQRPFRNVKEAAVWDIRQLFRSHWGFRVVNVLKVLHYQLYGSENYRAINEEEGY
ncbi:MAG TPA: DUF5063 domain-containing protein [Bacteroidales bacterium]|nr:DUF5063 domain-containing protein [Bacteroidales bacterium]HQH15236.1 DUF5063 domain-containing protein [Bacteroidales bacterium]